MTCDYNTFKELFDFLIIYYDSEGGVCISKDENDPDWAAAVFDGLIIYNNGTIWHPNLGGVPITQTYNPRLWPKILSLTESLIETDAEKVLFKR